MRIYCSSSSFILSWGACLSSSRLAFDLLASAFNKNAQFQTEALTLPFRVGSREWLAERLSSPININGAMLAQMRLSTRNSRKRQQERKGPEPNMGASRTITGAVGPYAFSTTPSGGAYTSTLTVTNPDSKDLKTQYFDAIAALERYVISKRGQIWTRADADEVKRLTRLVRAIMASQRSTEQSDANAWTV